MKRLTLTHFTVAAAALLTLASGAFSEPKTPTPAEQVANAQFVEMTYLSLCGQKPDPASFAYHWGQLNEGAKHFNDVRDAIKGSCQTAKSPESCQRISGLDACK